MGVIIFIYLSMGIICAIIGKVVGSKKGRGDAGLVLGFLLGPIGIVIALLLPIIADSKMINAEIADLTALTKERGKVGIGIDPKDGRTIVSVEDKSSAKEAGILVGDRIISIDGVLCEGDYKAVVLKIVGDKGSVVRLTVRRGDEALEFKIIRK